MAEGLRRFLDTKTCLFVEKQFKTEDCRCCSCHHVAVDHHTATCGDIDCSYGSHCCSVDKKSCPRSEKAVFVFKFACKFRKYGCNEVVELRNFLKHANICQFAINSTTLILHEKDRFHQALQKVTDSRLCRREATKSVIKEKSDRIKHAPKKSKKETGGPPTVLTEFTGDDISNQQKVELMKTVINQPKDDLKASGMTIEAMEVEVDEFQETKNSLEPKFENTGRYIELTEAKNRSDDALVASDNGPRLKELAEEIISKTEIARLKDCLSKSKREGELLIAEHGGKLPKVELQDNSAVVAVTELTRPRHLKETSIHSMLCTIDRIEERMQQLKCLKKYTTFVRSDEVICVTDGSKFKVSLMRDSSWKFVYIRLTFCKGSASTPFMHSRRYVLLDQSDESEKNNLELIDRPNFGAISTEKMMRTFFNHSRFFPLSLLQDENKYLKNDLIQIRIVLEPITLLSKQITSNDGVFVWQIDSYSKKKKDEVCGMTKFLVSNPFKTSVRGFHLEINLYLNGYGDCKGQFLSIYTRAIQGENDAFLGSSYTCTQSYHILDRSNSHPKEDIFREGSGMFRESHSKFGFSKFAKHSLVENPKYLKDDSLLIKVLVHNII